MSAASELFFGAIEQHEPEDMSFGQFLGLVPRRSSSVGAAPGSAQTAAHTASAAGQMHAHASRNGCDMRASTKQEQDAVSPAEAEAARPADASRSREGGSTQAAAMQLSMQGGDAQRGRHYYLAQAEIPVVSDRQRGSGADSQGGDRLQGQPTAGSGRKNGQAEPLSSLATLAEDLQPPLLLQGVAGGELQTNLWMSIRRANAGDWHPALCAWSHEGIMVRTFAMHMARRAAWQVAKCSRHDICAGHTYAGAPAPACTMTHTKTCCAWCGAPRRCSCTPHSRRQRCTQKLSMARCGYFQTYLSGMVLL